jgi:hypothetical protein
MLTANVDATALKARLNGTAGVVMPAIRARLNIEVGELTEYIKFQKLTGQVLKTRTGNLRNSVFYKMEDQGTQIVGTVDVSMPAARYGKAHEFGAHIPERVPVNAKALHWRVGGKDVFAMRAAAFDLPKRPFMSTGLADRHAGITAGIQESINEAISK